MTSASCSPDPSFPFFRHIALSIPVTHVTFPFLIRIASCILIAFVSWHIPVVMHNHVYSYNATMLLPLSDFTALDGPVIVLEGSEGYPQHILQ